MWIHDFEKRELDQKLAKHTPDDRIKIIYQWVIEKKIDLKKFRYLVEAYAGQPKQEQEEVKDKVIVVHTKFEPPVKHGPFVDVDHLQTEMRNLHTHFMRTYGVTVSGVYHDWHLYQSKEWVGSIYVSEANRHDEVPAAQL